MQYNLEALIQKGYVLVNDPAEFKVEGLLELYRQTYWAAERPEPIIEKSLKHSLLYGIFYKGRPVAFMRLVTDYATFAYLCDVIVDESHRGKGLSKWMLHEAFSREDMRQIRRICLMTKDAQGLYEQFGFKHSEYPERYMEILRG